ncbi:hypothetical protein IDM40_24825 [Nocardiopsis sp. HNM0947]|uniref:Uncharacterized protein n=1 Tax=Nocardiopsis coralli TaxID=2772213 RepID=A0ABR9PDJ5_9ACTN|nr:hypothetical protein [Nocardiopsis coralli]MBE3001893.1 hypothetical protein [Nocardiopsis coralli]
MHPCPVCHDKDQSARVTALVRSGTSNTSGSGTTHHGGSFGYSGGNTAYFSGSTSHHYHESQGQTGLAQALTLQLEGRPSSAWIVVGGTALILLIMIMAGAHDMVMLVLLAGTALSVAVAAKDSQAGCGCLVVLFVVGLIWEIATGNDSQAVLIGILSVVTPILVLGCLVGGSMAWSNYNDGESDRQRRFRVWSELFYCGRDDLVFHPESGQHAPVGDMHGLIDRVEPPVVADD